MPWRGVTVSEQRERFLQDYELNFYSLSELAERFNISRRTAYKWIHRFTDYGENGLSRTVPAAASLSMADRGIPRGGTG
jgi:putative transposase